MAKWKEPTDTAVAVTGVDPRARMKEIRAEVKAFLKGDTLGLAHLGDLPNTMEDARRVIVATQDLLEIEREKHRKATLHICELAHLLNMNGEEYLRMIYEMQNLADQVRNLNSLVETQGKHINALGGDMQQAQRERDAVLTTMKLLNVQPAQAVTMGYSNKERG